MNIFIGNDFDEQTARDYLGVSYDQFDLLPNVPVSLTESDAATVLNVSEQTIKRMVQAGQLKLNRHSIIAYIMQNMLVNQPLNLDKKKRIFKWGHRFK